jgi:excisionase family DNA binding protein
MTTAEDTREYLTVAELAEKLRCSEPTIRPRIASGELLAVKLGQGRNSAIRVPRDAVVAWLERATGS